MILIFLLFKNINQTFINFIYKKEKVKFGKLIIFNLEMMKIFFFKKFILFKNFVKQSIEKYYSYIKEDFPILESQNVKLEFYSLFNFFKNLISENLKKNKFIYQISTKWIYKKVFQKNNETKIENFLKKNLFKKDKFSFYKSIFMKQTFKWNNIYIIFKNNFIYYLPIFIIIIFLYTFFKIFTYSLYLYNYYYIAIFFFYLLLHKTFFHLSKQYLNGKYTSQIQRFWKRSLSIFWLLETSLFFIFVFLTLISPSEQKYLIINFKEVNNYIVFFNNNNQILVYIFILLLSTIIYLFILFFKKKNNYIAINLLFIIITYIYIYILFLEFSKFFYLFNWYSFKEFNVKKYNYENTNNLNLNMPISLNNFYLQKTNINKFSITINHYMTIIIILKFWHIFFIIILFLINMYKYIETNTLSFDTLAVLQQNNIFILIFFISSYIFFLKNKFIYLFSYLYNFCNTNLLFNFKLNYFLEELLNIHLFFFNIFF